ncbi:divergent polysaccharide deacteylase family protein [Phaeobacter sp. HF9A]|uniref:divergent polysaccharide deacteylase family protein n=1 Tax=Phaeobacter sp. HF9A TaxID=2721561 RepID=UPI0014309829|nr:divergent polysaccharide deacetylase family protein [Phaeobacter sp. HF9A]NIZ12660.1 polysaccharide deacteylase family 2 protein [Phaeobacter sp. HF9A]
MRGFLGGVSAGALVAVTGAAVWSLSTPLPVVGVAGEVPDLVLTPRQDTPTPESAPRNDADLVETAPTGPSGPSSDGIEDQGSLADIVTESASQPEATMGVADVDGDESTGTAPEIAADTSDTAEPPATAERAALPEPGTDETPEVPTAPAAPPADTLTDTVAEPSMPTPEAGTELPAAQSPSSDADPIAEVELPGSLLPETFDAPEATLPPSITTPAAPPVLRSDQGETDAEADSGLATDEKDLRIADLPQATGDSAEEGPRIGTRVVPLTERDTSALPLADPQSTPFERNSEPAAVTPGLPLMSIVLIEEEGAVGAEALAEFPYPLTFAVDPSDPMAAKRMAERRADGFEVMVLADLPRDAGPQDAETALPVWFDRLPETIGLLEGVTSGVQGNRALADQVSDIAGDLGYGLVLQDNGLNTVQKMALRDGVPAGVVFRDFDGAGQDPRAMRRFLDQAAFRAGQEGAVIMLGRLKPDTISALLIWGLQDRAERVTLVPVSASLKRLQNPTAE